MTNRDYILKTCPYDLLLNLNDCIKFNPEYVCLMEYLRDDYIYSENGDKERCRWSSEHSRKDCEKCIQRWLNERR